MGASESLSCENNNSSLFSAVPDSSIMYQNKDSNLISVNILKLSISCAFTHLVLLYLLVDMLHPSSLFVYNVCWCFVKDV